MFLFALATDVEAPVPPIAPPAAATAAPVTAPAPATAPTASPYAYRFVPYPPKDPASREPRIYAIYLNDKKLHSRGPILIRVDTTPDVVKVVSRSRGQEGEIPQIAPGDFEATSRLPAIPFIASGMAVKLEFIAFTADGRKTSVFVPMQLAQAARVRVAQR